MRRSVPKSTKTRARSKRRASDRGGAAYRPRTSPSGRAARLAERIPPLYGVQDVLDVEAAHEERRQAYACAPIGLTVESCWSSACEGFGWIVLVLKQGGCLACPTSSYGRTVVEPKILEEGCVGDISFMYTEDLEGSFGVVSATTIEFEGGGKLRFQSPWRDVTWTFWPRLLPRTPGESAWRSL